MFPVNLFVFIFASDHTGHVMNEFYEKNFVNHENRKYHFRMTARVLLYMNFLTSIFRSSVLKHSHTAVKIDTRTLVVDISTCINLRRKIMYMS